MDTNNQDDVNRPVDPAADDFDEEGERRKVATWADGAGQNLWQVESLIDLALARRHELGAEQIAALRDFKSVLSRFHDGETPMEILDLQVTLEQGCEDSRGTRIWSVKVDDDGVRAEVYGSEWQRGVGSDSWSGPGFFFGPDRHDRDGDFFSFVAEFEDAICNQECRVRVLRNDDAVGVEDEDESSEGVQTPEVQSAPNERQPTETHQMLVTTAPFTAESKPGKSEASEELTTLANALFDGLLDAEPAGPLPAPDIAKRETVKPGRTTIPEKAEVIVARLVRSVIRELQQMVDPAMLLSGDSSGLINVWDEICVQRQVENSFAWGAYEQTIRAFIDGKLEDIPYGTLRSLWLLTPCGLEWAEENQTRNDPNPRLPDIAEYVFDEVLHKASDHTNARIRAYCDRPYRD